MTWLIIIFVITIIYIVFGLLLPAKVSMLASRNMSGEAKDIYKRIEDFNNWKEWAIWNEDQTMDITISNQTEGIGAWYRWKSKIREIKDGLIILTDAQPNKKLSYEFYYSTSKRGEVIFNLEQKKTGTFVTCTITIANKRRVFSRYFLILIKHSILHNIEEVLLKIDKRV